MDWRESVNCQNCITLNKKFSELFDLFKQKCRGNDDIAKNLLSLKRAYDKSIKVLESKSKKLVDVRNKLKDAGKNEEMLKRKVAEFQLRLVSSDTKYQEALRDIENERDRFTSLSKMKEQLEENLQVKENEMASLSLISKQSEERHGNEVQNFKSEIAKIQAEGSKGKYHRLNTKKLLKLESQLNEIFKDGYNLSKGNNTKLKRIISRISSTVNARKLEAELNSPSMTPEGTPSPDTGIFSGDEDFENPSLADDLNISCESSDDDFEDVEQPMNHNSSFLSTEIQEVQNPENTHSTSLMSPKPNCDTSTSQDSFDDGETTLCPLNNDFGCSANESNLSSFVGSPPGHSTQMSLSNETDHNIESGLTSQNVKHCSPGMESSVDLPDLLTSKPLTKLDVSLKIPHASSAQNISNPQKLQDCNPQILNEPNLDEEKTGRQSSNSFHHDPKNAIVSGLEASIAPAPSQLSVETNLESVEEIGGESNLTLEDDTTAFGKVSCNNLRSLKESLLEDPDDSLPSEQLSGICSKNLEEVGEERNLVNDHTSELEDVSSQGVRSPMVPFVPALMQQLLGRNAESVESASKHENVSEILTSKSENSFRGLTSPRSSPMKDLVALSTSQEASDRCLEFTSAVVNAPDIAVCESANILHQSLAVSVEEIQEPDQFYNEGFEELNNTHPRNKESEVGSTANTIVDSEICNPVLCVETSCSSSKSSGIKLIDVKSQKIEDTNIPEQTSCDVEFMLDEWKLSCPILPFSDDSCDGILSAANADSNPESPELANGRSTRMCRTTANLISVATNTEEFPEPPELANGRSTTSICRTTANLISVATNTEEIQLNSVALSPFAKFGDHHSYQSSTKCPDTVTIKNSSKESGISPICSRMDKAVSPIRLNYRDVGVLPIQELRKDVALSPLKTNSKSAATSPMRCIFNDTAVSPIRVKRLDAICGSVTFDKGIQVSLNEPREISLVPEKKIQLQEWSREVKLLHQTLEVLGINSGDLASVVTDKILVEELKKTLQMALKNTCHSINYPSREPEDRYKRPSFCQFEACELAEICNQQHYNLHLLAKSKNIEQRICSIGKAEKPKVKRLNRVKQKRKKTMTFLEKPFKEENTLLFDDSVDQVDQNLEVQNQTPNPSMSSELTPPLADRLSTSSVSPSVSSNSHQNLPCYRNTEIEINSFQPVSQSPIEISYCDLRTAKNLQNSDSRKKSSLSLDLSLTSDEEKLCETENACSLETLKNSSSKSSNPHMRTTSSDYDREIECEKNSANKDKESNCIDKNEDHKSTSNLSLENSLRKTSRKRQSSRSESSLGSVGECELSNTKTTVPLRRSPRVKRTRVAHNFDSESRYSYPKGHVKFVKGETQFVSSAQETSFGQKTVKRNLAEGKIDNLILRNEKEVSEALVVPSSNLSVPGRKAKADCDSITPFSQSFDNKGKNSNSKPSNSSKRIAEDQLMITENKLKRLKQASPKMSSDNIDDTDDERLIISSETDDNEQDEANLKDAAQNENQRVPCLTTNITASDNVEKNMETLFGTVSSKSESRSAKFDETTDSPNVSQYRTKAASGKPSKLQRLRSSVSKVHPLAQATRTTRFSEEADVDLHTNERMKKVQHIMSSPSSKDSQSKLQADILEKFKGRESVRMAAAASGRTAQLIPLNSVNSVRQKASVARPSLAMGSIKPVNKTTSIQPLVRPEDRLLSSEKILPLKNRKDSSIQPKKQSIFAGENPPDVDETIIRKDVQHSSFLITDDVGFQITTLGPLAYAIADRHIPETPHYNKNELKNTEKLVQETLKKLVAASSFTPDVLQRAIDALSHPELENVLIVLVRDVVKMMDDDYDTPPLRNGMQQVFAPPLTPVQQQLLTLVLQLSFQHQHLKQLPHEILRLLEYRLFRLGKTPEGQRLQWCASFYAAICRVLSLRSEALIFCWDALYTLRIRSYDVVKAVMDVWPHLFPINPNFEKACPNAQVMLHLLKCHVEKPSAEQQSKKFDNSWLKRMLRSSGVQSTSINSTLLSSKLFSNLIDGTLNTNVTALVLLAKREEVQWTMKNVISGNFLPALEKWRARSLSDAAGERVIWTMCSILRALPPERNSNTSHTVLKLLKSELLQTDNGSLTSQMQEVIAIGLALLSKHDIETVAHSLMSWNPHHGSSKGYSSRLLQHLSSIINSGSRPLSWWKTKLNQLPKSKEE